MSKAEIVTDIDGRFYGVRTACKGCGEHLLPTDWTPTGYDRSPHIATLPQWTFNGDLERPTFAPSINTEWTRTIDGVSRPQVCHSYVTNGRIQYLGDCTHELAGQTVDLPELVDT